MLRGKLFKVKIHVQAMKILLLRVVFLYVYRSLGSQPRSEWERLML